MNKGYSLVEVALAILILSIITLSVVYFGRGFFLDAQAKQITRWLVDLKDAVNKYSLDNQAPIDSLSSLSSYITIPKEVQEMSPQWLQSTTVNCYGGVPVSSVSGYAVSLTCRDTDLCMELQNRLKDLGWCISLSGNTIKVAMR